MFTEVKPDSGRLSIKNDDQAVVILLIDDDPDCRTLICDAIAECKVSNTVVEVANGKEAMDYLHRRGRWKEAKRPGLIYLDIEMPEMDGQAVLKQIKADPKLREIPVVMMTGVSDEEEMQRAMLNGANSYTLKPANAEQFLRTVLMSTNYWLNIHQYPQHHLPQEQCLR
ncbi:MAG TPA: response regulator [Tepidisphaeraceae bacterium]|nr:response regulator [Tepidisphaeraceae bacterium]